MVQRMEDFYTHPQTILSSTKDEGGKLHNDNGPALITTDNVYFISHGRDWSEQKYEIYIRDLAKTLYPGMKTETAPFSQLESIVLASQGWGQRITLFQQNMRIRIHNNGMAVFKKGKYDAP